MQIQVFVGETQVNFERESVRDVFQMVGLCYGAYRRFRCQLRQSQTPWRRKTR